MTALNNTRSRVSRAVAYEIRVARRVFADADFRQFAGLTAFWAAGMIGAWMLAMSLLPRGH